MQFNQNQQRMYRNQHDRTTCLRKSLLCTYLYDSCWRKVQEKLNSLVWWVFATRRIFRCTNRSFPITIVSLLSSLPFDTTLEGMSKCHDFCCDQFSSKYLKHWIDCNISNIRFREFHLESSINTQSDQLFDYFVCFQGVHVFSCSWFFLHILLNQTEMKVRKLFCTKKVNRFALRSTGLVNIVTWNMVDMDFFMAVHVVHFKI